MSLRLGALNNPTAMTKCSEMARKSSAGKSNSSMGSRCVVCTEVYARNHAKRSIERDGGPQAL